MGGNQDERNKKPGLLRGQFYKNQSSMLTKSFPKPKNSRKRGWLEAPKGQSTGTHQNRMNCEKRGKGEGKQGKKIVLLS